MKNQYSTEKIIEELTIATYGENASERQKHAFTEALRGLVRLAKSEQMLELQENVKNLTQLSSDSIHAPSEAH